jgi:hypothetical protein
MSCGHDLLLGSFKSTLYIVYPEGSFGNPQSRKNPISSCRLPLYNPMTKLSRSHLGFYHDVTINKFPYASLLPFRVLSLIFLIYVLACFKSCLLNLMPLDRNLKYSNCFWFLENIFSFARGLEFEQKLSRCASVLHRRSELYPAKSIFLSSF